MKTKLLALFLVLSLLLTAFASCSGCQDDEPTGDKGDGTSTDDTNTDGTNTENGANKDDSDKAPAKPAELIYTLNAAGDAYTLTDVKINDSLNLTIAKVYADKPVTAIAPGVLAGCQSLKVLTIPDSIKTIGENAFSRCPSLETLNIGYGVESIGAYAFFGCTGLRTITVHTANPVYEEEYGSVIEKATDKLIFCTNNMIIPNDGSVTVIGDGAFAFYPVGVITIPAAVKTLGKDLFYGCPYISTFNYEGTKAEWQALTKDPAWNREAPTITVICSDGNLTETYAPGE